jgi:hypothetical protein
MKKFVGYLFCIICLWFVFDRIGGTAMWWLNQRSLDSTSPKIREIVESVDADVVIMGTSRCNCHYVPSILQDTLGMTTYNAGIDGSDNIFAQYMALCYLLQRHKPKVLCLEVQNSFIEEEESAFRTTGFFAPYFGLNEKADHVFRLSGDYWLYQISHLYRFNTKVLANLTGQVKSHWYQNESGYLPKERPVVFPSPAHWGEEEVIVNETKVQYLKMFVDECRTNGIALCFVISPAYGIAEPSYYAQLHAFADSLNIPLLDYHTSGLFIDHQEYFKDCFHLWDEGARLYSSIFASDLKRILQLRR